MGEFISNPEQQGERPIDRELVIGRLQEYGVEIEPEDLEGLDDNEVMSHITTYILMYDLDMDDIFPEVLPIEERHEKEGEVWERIEIPEREDES